MDYFKNNLKYILEATGLTASQAARLVKTVDRQAMSKYVTGKTLPNIKKVDEIADALNLPPALFLIRNKEDVEAVAQFYERIENLKKAKGIKESEWAG